MMFRYRINKSAAGNEYEGTCEQYPYLWVDGDTYDEALQAIQDAVLMEMERLEEGYGTDDQEH